MPKPNTMDDLDEILERNKSIQVRRKQLYSIVPIGANALDSSKAIEAKLKEEFGEPLYLKQALTAKLKEVDGCPCLLVKPCSSNCSCANSVMSGGCMRCCKYGSKEQRIKAAQRIVEVDRAARIEGFEDALETAEAETYTGYGGRNDTAQTIKNATRAIKNMDKEKMVLHNIYVDWYYQAGEDWIIKKLKDRLASLKGGDV